MGDKRRFITVEEFKKYKDKQDTINLSVFKILTEIREVLIKLTQDVK